MLSTEVIKLDSVSVAYGKTIALHDINLNVSKGEKIALIGPSGAGKTTLLRKLYENIFTISGKEPGFIHQDFALIEQLSIFHNVYIGQLDHFSLMQNLRNFLFPSSIMQAEIRPILTQLGLAEKIFVKAGELSGGQKQRLAIARCLFKQADVILADEPVASLDLQQGETILDSLLHAASTVVVSLHSIDLALRCCNRIIALREGHIVFDGLPEEINQQKISELFRQ